MSISDDKSVTRLFNSTSVNKPRHQLKIETGNPLMEAFVINGALDLVAQGQDSLVEELPEGTYQVKFRAGNAITEQWVNLSGDLEISPESIPVPDSSLPSEDNWSNQELEAAQQFIAPHNLAVIIRDPEHEITPSDQVSIRSLTGEIFVQTRIDRSCKPGWVTLTNAPVLGLGGSAEPGAYLLRVSTPEIGTYEMIIWVSSRFKTRVYLTRKFASSWKKRRRTPHLGSATIHMVANDSPSPDNERRSELTEIILAAHREDRLLQLSNDFILQALSVKTEHPMLGLFAAHMLHIQIKNKISSVPEGEDSDEIIQMRQTMMLAINNLNNLIPGCPDIGILGLAYGLELSGIDYSIPPMLVQSWNIMATAENGRLVPKGSYASRISGALTIERPWLIWRTNQMLPANLENIESMEIESLLNVRKYFKSSGKTISNSLAQQIIDTPLSQYQSFQDLAQVLGVPESSVETSIAQMHNIHSKSK
ncbi:hypothetical protein ACH5Y9_01085 [Methylomonas sp. BW4-1]|uniref:hypothetical protein n=1 Tax=Methylomonas sp. BW4-1 TaxID=3376685 RepID=UPI0040423A5B